MSTSSTTELSEDETPRRKQFDDFDFFDSDTDKKEQRSSQNTSSQDVLHGTKPSEPARKPLFVVRNNRKPQKTYVSSSEINLKPMRGDDQELKPDTRETLTVHVPIPQQREETDSTSSDSVFDVSPLPTPSTTPRPDSTSQKSRKKQPVDRGTPEQGDKKSHEESKEKTTQKPHSRVSNGEALSIEDLLYSSDSSPDSSDARSDNMQRKKAVQRKKRSKYEGVLQRTEASSRLHRRRLLDAAAENSMDLSQLLEVVLEMEHDRKTQKNFSGGRMSKNMLPPPIKGFSKKNMSFTNEQVHNIDRENQRLMRRLAQLNSRQRPSSASSVRSAASSCRSGASTKRSSRRPTTAGSAQYGLPPSHGPRTYHSAVNRVRDQQRIERENLALLKRLQQTKSSSSLRRDNLLRDYERQTGRIVETRPPSRRKQRSGFGRRTDYEANATDRNYYGSKPAWQDSW